MSTDTPPGFYAARTRAMKREGVAGWRTAVTLRAGRLAAVGEDGGAIWVDPADVARMRVGYEESKRGKHFQTRIWRTGQLNPLVLHPLTQYDPNYSATIQAFAAAVAAIGGVGRIERGITAFWAWAGPVLMGLLFLAAAAVGIVVLADHVWWQRCAVALVPGVLFAVLLWNTLTRLAPRPIVELSELDKQLP